MNDGRGGVATGTVNLSVVVCNVTSLTPMAMTVPLQGGNHKLSSNVTYTVAYTGPCTNLVLVFDHDGLAGTPDNVLSFAATTSVTVNGPSRPQKLVARPHNMYLRNGVTGANLRTAVLTTDVTGRTMTPQRSRKLADRGSVLPIVLVIVVVLEGVVFATAEYATSTLRYGRAVESRADRLSAAEGGIRDIIDRITNSQLPLCSTAAGVGGIDMDLPDISGADITVRCQQVGGQLADMTSWAVVITGEGGVPNGEGLTTQSGGEKIFGGPTYIARQNLLGLQRDLLIEQGDLWYSDASCTPAEISWVCLGATSSSTRRSVASGAPTAPGSTRLRSRAGCSERPPPRRCPPRARPVSGHQRLCVLFPGRYTSVPD